MTRSARLMVRNNGVRDYVETWRAMQAFTDTRNETTADEVWLLEHNAVFTQGLNGRRQHLHDTGSIPVIQVDRGGQVTYHGPGQLVMYVLMDLERLGIGVRRLVGSLENSVIALLGQTGIRAQTSAGAPGVYVNERKIASVGLRVRRGCCYHGIALNVNMDLEPFRRIDPCGFPELQVTQLKDLGGPDNPDEVAPVLVKLLASNLGYTTLVDS